MTATTAAKAFDGTYRRLIDLKTWDEHTVVGWLEDDFHHFGLTLIHDGRVATDVRVAAVRYPMTTCAAALDPLKAVIGQPLIGRCTDIGRQLEMRTQCTHLFDLLGLMSAHAFHRNVHHRYHAAVHAIAGDPARAGWVSAQLWRDDEPVLAWELCDGVIRMPAAHAGRTVERGFRAWTEAMDETEAEYASVLRRAVFVSGARFKVRPKTLPSGQNMAAPCHSFQPEIFATAKRDGEHSELRAFDAGPEGMIARVDTKP